MKKFFATAVICILASVSCFAQYSTTYHNQYGSTTGIATTTSNYGGGTTTTFKDSYGSITGIATTNSNYSGDTTPTY